MSESFDHTSALYHDEQEPPKPRITLKLPSLSSLKPQKKQKPPRPVKLKPLKEVLSKLISQIKKKDDYAFFLHPVDVAQVPGYSTVVKRPMDFGTMTTKVSRGKYRSLEEFTSDVRLVTGNAKAFNPVGTIYYTEADKIEVYALDAISRASGTVVQYETDWNIDVENDEEVEAEDGSGPMDLDEPISAGQRSQSVVSATVGRRATRGPYKKQQAQPATTDGSTKGPLSETIQADGRLPGSRDGLGAFPANSGWSKTMLALKLKGKKYKTKKERMRIEKEGPPMHPDGSLDYWEMEDPFTILSALVPDPLTRPQMSLLWPPPPPLQPTESRATSATPAPQPLAGPSSLGSVALPPKREPHIPPVPPEKKHWIVQTSYSSRGFKKEEPERIPEKLERPVHTVDWGSFALLSAEMSEELKRRGITDNDGIDLVRESLDPEDNSKKRKRDDAHKYWNLERAAQGEDYLRDVVYGGVDGYAYVRSLAEFVKRPKTEEYRIPDEELELGMPLAKYVEQQIVDPLTEGKHGMLRETARLLGTQRDEDVVMSMEPGAWDDSKILAQIQLSEMVQPLLNVRGQKLDMGSLMREPADLDVSEREWDGLKFRREGKIETQDELGQILGDTGDMLARLASQTSSNDVAEGSESAETRRLRMNLLALAKRLPVTMISPLEKRLVAENVRNILPTIE
ncbi:hypothetical protein CYLTODRAFT_401358 [Cylindrobasidium torrendii FP15055 ss-10]|uniref:Bromo domain-containing protein n=1 Tax=Cylindrobasidium torrendii FP15055 ss-10 TaxID=1314674 RepID=A0A0D7B3U4_9AGAR|nr:hypothetical protein CYLTODRAFT_401358 [Cylindrobasidium torrendii FP15055 ss-10]